MEAFSLVKFSPPVRLIDSSVLSKVEGIPISLISKREASDEVKQLLDSMLPPREFEHEGFTWRQTVSPIKANRLETSF